MKELNCPEERCYTDHCSHIKAVLAAMKDAGVEAEGDRQVCGLGCRVCDDFHGF